MMLKRLALTASSAHDASCSPTYKFTGYEFDSETGDYYAYARYYNPRLGRFMSPDPMDGNVANLQSLNRYTYVLNNPMSLIDPLGLDCKGTIAIVVTPHGASAQYVVSCSDDGGGGGSEFGGGGGCTAFLAPSTGNCPTETPQIGPLPSTQQGTQTKPQTKGHPLANCIANSGNEASLQGILKGVSGGKLGNGWFATAFLGNPISDAIQFLTGNGSGAAAAADVVSGGAPSALRAVPNVSFSYTSTTVTATHSEFSAVISHIEGYVPLGDIASGAADVLEGFGYLVQAPVDITAIGFGAVVCSAGSAGG